MNTPVSFELAKLLKEKGFDKPTQKFYPKPKCKLFGMDEHDRPYPIINKTRTYDIDEAAVLKEENAYYAPIIVNVLMWLYEKHGIWIQVISKNTSTQMSFKYEIKRYEWDGCIADDNLYNSPTEAYEAAIKYTLKKLI